MINILLRSWKRMKRSEDAIRFARERMESELLPKCVNVIKQVWN